MIKVVILSAGPGLPEIVEEYGHSSDWIPKLLSDDEIEFSIRKVYENDFGALDEADAWIITGSKYSVYDNCDWIEDLKIFVSKLILNNKPILGICFGHQLIANCLGAEVKKNTKGWELGSYNIILSEAGKKHKLLEGLIDGDIVYESHQDVVCNMTKGMIELAITDKANQSFSYNGNTFGVQFHPEFSYKVTRKLMDLRIQNGIKVDSNILSESENSQKVLTNFISLVKGYKYEQSYI